MAPPSSSHNCCVHLLKKRKMAIKRSSIVMTVLLGHTRRLDQLPSNVVAFSIEKNDDGCGSRTFRFSSLCAEQNCKDLK